MASWGRGHRATAESSNRQSNRGQWRDHRRGETWSRGDWAYWRASQRHGRGEPFVEDWQGDDEDDDDDADEESRSRSPRRRFRPRQRRPTGLTAPFSISQEAHRATRLRDEIFTQARLGDYTHLMNPAHHSEEMALTAPEATIISTLDAIFILLSNSSNMPGFGQLQASLPSSPLAAIGFGGAARSVQSDSHAENAALNAALAATGRATATTATPSNPPVIGDAAARRVRRGQVGPI